MDKKKKRKILKNKEKIFIIVIAIVAFVVILGIALMPVKKNTNTVENNIVNKTGFSSIQEVIEYLEGTYISTENSKVDGYDIDIYVNFPKNLFENENSQEAYFKNVYEKVTKVSEFKSFRLIDTSKNITIEIKCKNNKISEVKINGEKNYFKNEVSRRSKDNKLQMQVLDLEINSEELESLIKNNWTVSSETLGTPESKFFKYDIYFDEGYEIRTIQGKVFNIVFNKKYGKKVIEDYKPGDSIEKVTAQLGEGNNLPGIAEYKTKDFYVIFTDEEISIYPNRLYDYIEFEELVKKYNENQNTNEFLYELTDIWPDYDVYEYNEYYVELYYSLKGVKISFSSDKTDGIQIYENYNGELKDLSENLKDVYYKLNENLLIDAYKKTRLQKTLTGSWEESEECSGDFYIATKYENNGYKNIKIYSLREDCPNNEFDEHIVAKSYVWADNEHLIYSISNDGIYMYTATTRQHEKMLDGKQTFDITNYDRNTNILEYDGQRAKVSF